MHRFRSFAVAALTLIATALLLAPSAGADDLPDLPAPQEIKKGVNFHEVTLRRAGVPMKLWVYLPKPAPAADKLPCILIAPAGTRLFHGMALGDGDRDEHLPYVGKGFAVVAYEVDGDMSDDATPAQMAAAIAAFRKADGGVANAVAALDYAAAKIPQVDMKRVYAVGHSSAATTALQVAQREPRVAACVAFAPACDLADRLKPFGAELDGLQAGTMEFLRTVSPERNAAKLKCPTMLFTAMDDETISSKSVGAFAAALQKTNDQVKFIAVKSGGHHDSMIERGIPAAIAWLKALPAAKAGK
jgi:dienelactone hydrolase